MAEIIELDPKARGGRKKRTRPVTVGAHNGTPIRRPVGYARRAREVATARQILDRRAKAYKLRVAKFSNRDIGLFLHADPSVNTDKSYAGGLEGGYGWQNYRNGLPPLLDEALAVSVSRDISRGLQIASKYEQLAREEYVELECAALDAAQAGMWPKITSGDARTIEVFVKVAERRAKLRGLDAPVQTESKVEQSVTVTGIQPVYDQAYAAAMFDALQQAGAIEELPDVPAVGTGDDIVDAEVVPPADG